MCTRACMQLHPLLTQPIPSRTGTKHARAKQKQKIHQTHCLLFVTAGDPPPSLRRNSSTCHTHTIVRKTISRESKHGNVHIGETREYARMYVNIFTHLSDGRMPRSKRACNATNAPTLRFISYIAISHMISIFLPDSSPRIIKAVERNPCLSARAPISIHLYVRVCL